jgi:CheY-like chemotaxis protein
MGPSQVFDNSSGHRRGVLLIDHESSVREVLQVCLDYLGGWDVQAVSNPYQGLAILRNFVPEVILLDAPLLETNAATLVAHLRQHPRLGSIPIVLITGRAGWLSKPYLQTIGVAGVLSKPFNPLTLPDQIRDILRTARGTSKLA